MEIFRPYNQNWQGPKQRLLKYLKALAIAGSTTYAKKSDDEKNEFCPLADINIVNQYNNCYSTNNNIIAIVIEDEMYIIPVGIIQEFLIKSCNLTSKEFEVPLSDSDSDSDYLFKNEEDNQKWQTLLRLQESLKVKKQEK